MRKIRVYRVLCTFLAKLRLARRKVIFGQGLSVVGLPYFKIYGRLVIGENLRINSGLRANPVYNRQNTVIVVKKNAIVSFGDNVGLSNVVIYSEKSVSIGNNTLLGAGVKIWDLDFHPLDYMARRDSRNVGKSLPIYVGSDCFIGAGTIILKGVSVGDRVTIGAGSVVTGNIPAGEVWAGNPARKLR